MMTTTARVSDRGNELECEFIPPLDAPESWGMPWDEQLKAVQAWQEAGGNQDGQESVAIEPADASNRKSTVSKLATARRQGTISPDAANESYPLAERRTREINIGFPDRRRSGT
jgi:uncharacterized Ntn-hydrolase superfamily protein